MSEEFENRLGEGKYGVQLLEIGMGILWVMVNGQCLMMLKDIVVVVDMLVFKVYCYLVSLIWVGLVEQDLMILCYDLGFFVFNIGFVVIDWLDCICFGLMVIV